ncbi:MAG: hypothetical protein NC126_00915 [Clostridium sp.]|nr:hypothetical protein [Clostridium sp.]
MNLKRAGFPLPKINDRGQAQWAAGLFMVLFLAVLLCGELQIESYRASALYLEDALAASNLASAVIDVEEYGISGLLQIKDPIQSYELYQEALKENLGLDEEWECANKGLISGKVKVERYIVYNVQGSRVFVHTLSADGEWEESTETLGELRAPDGVLIESTGIYSEISFPVEGFPGVTVQAHKGKLVDIKGTERLDSSDIQDNFKN